MKAEITDLVGKYYGTTVKILDGRLNGQQISIWLSSGAPSKREIESWGFSQEDWDNDAEVDDGWGGKTRIRTGGEYMSDGHYESEISYRIAQGIVELLKGID